MLHSSKRTLNSTLHATDGKIGYIDDLLFDDQTWVVRYIVVRTGGLLNRHRVLISPLGVARVDWENQSLNLGLTRQQIEESPDVDTDQPLFRQMEKRYFDYYNWPYYWTEMSVWGIDPLLALELEQCSVSRARRGGARNRLFVGDRVHDAFKVGCHGEACAEHQVIDEPSEGYQGDTFAHQVVE